jgi:hypothetical protein
LSLHPIPRLLPGERPKSINMGFQTFKGDSRLVVFSQFGEPIAVTKYPRWPTFSQPGQSALLLIDGRKMPRKRRCEQSSFTSCRRSPFLVFKSKFAVRSQRIPCSVAQGIYPQLFDIASYSYIGFISEGPKATKFPVLFPVSREFGSSRPVWQDYVHHLEVVANGGSFPAQKIIRRYRSCRGRPAVRPSATADPRRCLTPSPLSVSRESLASPPGSPTPISSSSTSFPFQRLRRSLALLSPKQAL